MDVVQRIANLQETNATDNRYFAGDVRRSVISHRRIKSAEIIRNTKNTSIWRYYDSDSVHRGNNGDEIQNPHKILLLGDALLNSL